MKNVLIMIALLCFVCVLDAKEFSISVWEYKWSKTIIDENNIPVDAWNNLTAANESLKSKKEKYLYLRAKIPTNDFKRPILYIDKIYHHFIVIQNNKKIYQYGDFDLQQNFLPYGDNHMVELSPVMKEQYVYLCIYSNLPKIGIWGKSVLAESDTHYMSMIKSDIDRLILSGVYIFVGLFQILLYFRRRKQTISLAFGLFSFVLGGYFTCWLEVKGFYDIPGIVWLYTEYLCLYMMPIFFCWFFKQIFGSGPKNIINKCIFLHTLCLLFGLILGFIDPFWWPKTLLFFQILFLFTIACVVVICCLAVAKGNMNAKIFIVGLMILSFFGVYDTLGDLGLVSWSRSLAHWGMLIFMVCISIILERRFYYTQINLEKVNKACSRFIPWKFLQLLGRESIAEVNLGDQIELKTTVLFSDIRSFTAISEKMTPQENFNFINSYLQYIVPVIRRYGGFVDKYMGDAIMAIFPGDPKCALGAAKEMIAQIKIYNKKQQEKGLTSIEIGIGVHSGSLMLGIIGETERMDCTVIADAVNTASRLEGLTKTYQVNIITSQSTLDNLEENIEHRFLDNVQVKGKKEPLAIYEIIT